MTLSQQDWFVSLERALVGRRCKIARQEFDWAAELEGGGLISLPVPWRIVADGRIAFAASDDGQTFGLPAPIDGEAKANELLARLLVTSIRIDEETADLSVYFEDVVRLDAFNNSSGYEGWQIILPPEFSGLHVIALGGGNLAVMTDPATH